MKHDAKKHCDSHLRVQKNIKYLIKREKVYIQEKTFN